MIGNGRFLNVIYCDDIRKEIGNKTTLVGCYDGDLIVGSLPTLLPKFTLYFTLVSALDKGIDDVKIQVIFGDNIIAEMNQGSADRPKFNPGPDARYLRMKSSIVLSPFFIEEPGLLYVKLTTDGEELISNKLNIREAKENEDHVECVPLEKR